MSNHNLCARPKAEQEMAAAETLACYWLWQLQNGQIARHDIQRRLADMQPAQRELHRAALNKHRHKYKG